MTRLLLALAMALVASVASAQDYGTPTEADLRQLPLAVQVWFPMPAGWTGHAEFWATAIWPRSGNGAWFRANATEYLVMTLYNEIVFPRPYTCKFVGYWHFICTDTFGETRAVRCPDTITASAEPREWTSDRARFVWDWPGGADQKWKAFAERITVRNSSGNVDDSGTRITCHYPLTKATGGEYDRGDLWVMLR